MFTYVCRCTNRLWGMPCQLAEWTEDLWNVRQVSPGQIPNAISDKTPDVGKTLQSKVCVLAITITTTCDKLDIYTCHFIRTYLWLCTYVYVTMNCM